MPDDNSPKKELGQHWLYDTGMLTMIVDSADVKAEDTVLEIGPGLGTLTEKLLERDAQVIALEYDTKLAESLGHRLQNKGIATKKLSVAIGDIRTYDFANIKGEYKIVANIPYYLTSFLMRALCDTEHKPIMASLLMQKEVAERIVSSRKLGLLSVIVQYDYVVSLGGVVPAEYFQPPPKVASQVLCMTKRAVPLFDADRKTLLRLFKAAFSEKRKNIKNALSGGLSLSKETIVRLLDESKIDETRRAESLSWDEWERLYHAYARTT